jgi:hypothetical protein
MPTRVATQRRLSILFGTSTGKETGFQPVARAIEPGGKLSDGLKMKMRCFDHIDLRVRDMEVARNFYRKFLPQLGFVHERPEPAPAKLSSDHAGEDFHTFYSAGGDKPMEFFGFTQDKDHRPNGTRIAF